MKTFDIALLAIGGYIAIKAVNKDDNLLPSFGSGGTGSGGSSFDFSNLFGGISPFPQPDAAIPEMGKVFQGLYDAIQKGFSEIPNPTLPNPDTNINIPNPFDGFDFPLIPEQGGIRSPDFYFPPFKLTPPTPPDPADFFTDIGSGLIPDVTMPEYTAVKASIVRSGGIGLRQYGGIVMSGGRTIRPIFKGGEVALATKPLRTILTKVGTKAGAKLGFKVAARGIPVVGWGLLAVDLLSDLARLGGANMPEWLGISGIIEPFTGSNPIEDFVSNQEKQAFEVSDVVTGRSPIERLTFNEANTGSPEAPSRRESAFPQPSETPYKPPSHVPTYQNPQAQPFPYRRPPPSTRLKDYGLE
ncbi:hypothetical protein CL622_05700 [archaeon]|nr:hypothetical protein [archaeon]